ncbi:MAG: ABC transporter ATP-binding protein [Legionellales bacterium]|nr:ABC transporter ATP-binding protein [Legionellales bacterium]
MQGICKWYKLGEHVHQVLDNVNFAVKPGELVSIMGASGSGKSTLMNIIGLLDRPSSGVYKLNGQDVSQINHSELARIRNQTMGFVFQQFFLLPRLSALQNVALPLQYSPHYIAHQREVCFSMLEKVGMEKYAKQKPHQLSGGQQQRVAIARALILHPSVLLADEPTGALDSKIGQEVMNLFIELNRQDKVTTVIITHDAKIADQCDRVVHVQDGKIVD